jgi:hypothetical protein
VGGTRSCRGGAFENDVISRMSMGGALSTSRWVVTGLIGAVGTWAHGVVTCIRTEAVRVICIEVCDGKTENGGCDKAVAMGYGGPDGRGWFVPIGCGACEG